MALVNGSRETAASPAFFLLVRSSAMQPTRKCIRDPFGMVLLPLDARSAIFCMRARVASVSSFRRRFRHALRASKSSSTSISVKLPVKDSR